MCTDLKPAVFLYASHSSQQSTSQFSNTCRHLSATAHKLINIVLKGSDDMWQRSMHLIIKYVPSLRICKPIDMQRGWYAMCLDEVDVLLIFFTGQWKQWRSTRSGPVSPPSLRGGHCLTTQVTPDSFFFYLFFFFYQLFETNHKSNLHSRFMPTSLSDSSKLIQVQCWKDLMACGREVCT